MTRALVDAATSIPVIVWAALLVAGTLGGLAILAVVRTLQQDARPTPARARSGKPGPPAPGPASPLHIRIWRELQRRHSYRRAARRELARRP